MEKTLTCPELSRLLDFSPKLLARWCQHGHLPARRDTYRWRISPRALLGWLCGLEGWVFVPVERIRQPALRRYVEARRQESRDRGHYPVRSRELMARWCVTKSAIAYYVERGWIRPRCRHDGSYWFDNLEASRFLPPTAPGAAPIEHPMEPWDREQEDRVGKMIRHYGRRWSRIARALLDDPEMPSRSPAALKDHMRALRRRRAG